MVLPDEVRIDNEARSIAHPKPGIRQCGAMATSIVSNPASRPQATRPLRESGYFPQPEALLTHPSAIYCPSAAETNSQPSLMALSFR